METDPVLKKERPSCVSAFPGRSKTRRGVSRGVRTFGRVGSLSAARGPLSSCRGMTYNAAYRDVSYLYRPDKTFRRVLGAGRSYLRAWVIGLSAIALSFLGLALFLVGFFYTSVWGMARGRLRLLQSDPSGDAAAVASAVHRVPDSQDGSPGYSLIFPLLNAVTRRRYTT